MPCYHPLKGWYSRERNKTGLRSIVFNPAKGYKDRPVELPCGQCIGCKLEKSRQWAIRCVHESQLYDENSFVTLTYNNENLPEDGNLVKRDFQLFMKRLRKAIHPRKIRFFMCGEYGAEFSRPHFHACIFGYDFSDTICNSIGKGSLKTSDLLQKLWRKGFSSFGDVTFESAAYVARYVTKKVNGEISDEHYVNKSTGVIREKEFCTMSRGGRQSQVGEYGKRIRVNIEGGIGKKWLDNYQEEVYNNGSDSVVMRGMELRPPKYYDKKYDLIDRGALRKLKLRRLERVKKLDYEQLVRKEKVEDIKNNLLNRRNYDTKNI